MSVIGDASILVRADTKGFAREVKTGVGGALRGLAGIATGIFASVGAAHVFTDIIKEATEARKVLAQTRAVIKSTGGVAHVSEGQVDELAKTLSGLAGVDDEVIQQGENLLLTFTSIRNEVGEGNDIFDQATRAAVDLSAALGQDMQSSVIQLGKALNDPIRGVTALRRVGVSFNAEQVKQIKAMVLSNNLLGAQKLILHELNTEFGGTAAAIATPWERMKVALKNVEETVGKALLPTLDALANFVSTTLAPAIETKVLPFLKDMFSDIGDIVKAVGPVAISAVKEFFKAFSGPEAQDAKDTTEKTADDSIHLKDVLESFKVDVAPAIEDAFAALGETFRTFGDFLGGVVDGIIQLGVHAKHVVRDVIGAFQAFGRFLDGFVERFRGVFQGIGDIFGGFKNIIFGIVGGVIRVFQGLISFLAGVFTLNWRAAWNGLTKIVSGVANILGGIISGIGRIFRGLFKVIAGVVVGLGREVGRAFKNAGTWLFNAGKDIIGGLLRGIGDVFKTGADIAKGFFNGIIHTIGKLASHLPGFIKKLIPDRIKEFFGIHSPSRLMFSLGESIGEGLTLGIQSGITFDPRSIDLGFGSPRTALAAGQSVEGFERVLQKIEIHTGHVDERVLANELAYRMGRDSRR